jgi:hypothetical protein
MREICLWLGIRSLDSETVFLKLGSGTRIALLWLMSLHY